MLVVVACPECGHQGRVPEKRLGHKVRCKGCGGTFRPDAAITQLSSETKKTPHPYPPPRLGEGKGGGLAEAKQGKTKALPGLFGLFKRPTVIEGAVLGAIAGVITGVIIGSIAGAVYAMPKKGIIVEEGSQGPIASGIGGGVTGFIFGFLAGTPIGALIGLVGTYFQAESFSEGWKRIVAFGFLIGAAVTAILVDRYWWIPIGGIVGGGGALLWLALQRWEMASDVPLVRDFDLEEEDKPTTPKTDL